MSKSLTPRTDVIVKARLDYTSDESVLDDYRAMVSHARQLERELAEADRLRDKMDEANDTLLAENVKQRERAEKAEAESAELRKDAERYWWLKANHLQTGADSWIRAGDDLEEAIDAALSPHEAERHEGG